MQIRFLPLIKDLYRATTAGMLDLEFYRATPAGMLDLGFYRATPAGMLDLGFCGLIQDRPIYLPLQVVLRTERSFLHKRFDNSCNEKLTMKDSYQFYEDT
jgi:hypothetical protein